MKEARGGTPRKQAARVEDRKAESEEASDFVDIVHMPQYTPAAGMLGEAHMQKRLINCPKETGFRARPRHLQELHLEHVIRSAFQVS